MIAAGPPVRFLIAVIGLWVAGRAAMLTWQRGQEAAVAVAPPLLRPSPTPRGQPPVAPSSGDAVVAERHGADAPPLRRRVAALGVADRTGRDRGAAPAVEPRRAIEPEAGVPELADAAPLSAPEPPGGLAGAAPAAPADRRWSGSVFLFARDGGGGGVPLAGGGQLGASQAGARIAYRIDRAGRLAAAARVYVPVDSARGAEAAVGLDLRPVAGAPLRLSVERRIAIGRDGRDAWSAYAAGGFFRGLGRTAELDGYAQAGAVGTKARDLFADGALRVARRIDLGGDRALLAGAGAWGAAQPGAARLDLGPRVALRLPAAGATISVAGEWRARIAGDARPRSGPALTVAADF